MLNSVDLKFNLNTDGSKLKFDNQLEIFANSHILVTIQQIAHTALSDTLQTRKSSSTSARQHPPITSSRRRR